MVVAFNFLPALYWLIYIGKKIEVPYGTLPWTMQSVLRYEAVSSFRQRQGTGHFDLPYESETSRTRATQASLLSWLAACILSRKRRKKATVTLAWKNVTNKRIRENQAQRSLNFSPQREQHRRRSCMRKPLVFLAAKCLSRLGPGVQLSSARLFYCPHCVTSALNALNCEMRLVVCYGHQDICI